MTNGNYDSRFASWLRVRMAEMSVTNNDLAKQIGVSHIAVSHWRIGKFQPRPHHLIKLAGVLRVKEETLKRKLGA